MPERIELLNFTGLPLNKSRVKIGDCSVYFNSQKPKPNRWFRFWYKVLLNWKWEDIDGH